MEGYLFKKGKAESVFGRRNWKRRWCVLEGHYFTYYEGFDSKTNKPYNKKGVIPVFGCKVKIGNDKNKEFSFDILHEERKPFSLQADDKIQQELWMKAIFEASNNKNINDEFDTSEYYELLDLDPNNKDITADLVNKIYRKKALVAHPDKGGDILEFKKLQEAVDIVLSKIEETEKEKDYETIFYDITVKKGPKNQGIGITVIEDKNKRQITVTGLLPTVKIISCSPESGGKILRHDRLVMIEDDDVMLWPLTRVVQRLGDSRVPPDSLLQLTLSRKVRIDGSNEAIDYDDEFIDDALKPKELYSLPSRAISPNRSKRSAPNSPSHSSNNSNDFSSFRAGLSRSFSSPLNRASTEPDNPKPILKSSKSSYGSSSFDIDESERKNFTIVNEPKPILKSSKSSYGSSNYDIDEIDGVNYTPVNEKISRNKPLNDNRKDETINKTNDSSKKTPGNTNTKRRSSSNIYGDIPSTSVSEALTKAHGELIDQINDLKKLLNYSNEEKSTLIHKQSDLEYENEKIKEENEKLLNDLQLSKFKEEYLDFQFQQALLHNEVTDEQVNKSVKDMVLVSALVKKGKDIAISDKMELYLSSEGLSISEVKENKSKYAKRRAIEALIAFDSSNNIIKKWSLSGNSCLDKLNRLEKRLNQLNVNSYN